jgi:uncharacterized protein YjiS (DUF1127 family)
MDSMAYQYGIVLPTTAPAPAGVNLAPWAQLLERAGRMILRVVAAHAASRQARGTLQELYRLNDRELADIGLTRADLDLMAVSRV